MRLLSFLSLIILMLPTQRAEADMSCSANGCTGVPNRVLVYPDGRIRIYPYSGNQAIEATSCTGVDVNNNAIDLADGPGRESTYSMLLMAIAAERAVFVRINSSLSNCTVFYIRFTT